MKEKREKDKREEGKTVFDQLEFLHIAKGRYVYFRNDPTDTILFGQFVEFNLEEESFKIALPNKEGSIAPHGSYLRNAREIALSGMPPTVDTRWSTFTQQEDCIVIKAKED
jgi:hypothetical protein